ncbi:MAG: ATP-binding protein [Deltaproteobacteria bacterium]|nr:ATP-binding protein [Deltaproteobacteria bacterium]
MAPKELPLGDPTFREIIQGNLLYADKTNYVFNLIKGPKSCFLSRPRRFGKTLLLDTLEELFRGNRELFKGLKIDGKKDCPSETHPILRLNMAYDPISAKEDLMHWIEWDLCRMAKKENVEIFAKSYNGMLEELLDGLSQKFGKGVVVLIDEYDAPVAGHISNRKLASDNRGVLYGFYTSIKKNLKYIRFVFVTGVTRFTMTALDSGPNNFVDISLDPNYAGICGFTLSEFNRLFSGRLRGTLGSLKTKGAIDQNTDRESLKAMILDWYDGYNWLGTQPVLNPYSILNFFNENRFGDYWPSLGIPTHLSALVREKPMEFMQPCLNSYTSDKIRKIDLGGLEAIPLLFHSGYLTIDGVAITDVIVKGKTAKVAKVEEFTFRTPNLEVELNYQASFFQAAFGLSDRYFTSFSKNLPKSLSERDSEKLVKVLSGLLHSITYLQHIPSEAYYHSLLHTAFLASGIVVMSEASGAHGRSDMALSLEGEVRVAIEFKYCHADPAEDDSVPAAIDLAAKDLSAALDDAEKQLRRGKYGESLMAISSDVICLALAIRGRAQVAARFVEPGETGGPPIS